MEGWPEGKEKIEEIEVESIKLQTVENSFGKGHWAFFKADNRMNEWMNGWMEGWMNEWMDDIIS
jgi:hypothetical protein